MTVTVDKAAKSRRAKAPVEVKLPAEPKAQQKYRLMLGLQIKRYVLHDGTQGGGKLFEQGIEYSVSAADRERLFKLKDDDGVRIFYDAELIREQMKATLRKRRAQRAAAGDEGAQEEIAQEEADRNGPGEGDTAVADRRRKHDTGAVELNGVGTRVAT